MVPVWVPTLPVVPWPNADSVHTPSSFSQSSLFVLPGTEHEPEIESIYWAVTVMVVVPPALSGLTCGFETINLIRPLVAVFPLILKSVPVIVGEAAVALILPAFMILNVNTTWSPGWFKLAVTVAVYGALLSPYTSVPVGKLPPEKVLVAVISVVWL